MKGKGKGRSKGMREKGKNGKGQGCFMRGSDSHWSKEYPQAKHVNAITAENVKVLDRILWFTESTRPPTQPNYRRHSFPSLQLRSAGVV